MTRFSINMVTVDRSAGGRRNYLGDTLGSLARSGLFERDDFELVLWESGSPSLEYLESALAAPGLRRVRVEPADRRLSVNENVSRALRAAAASGPEYVLLLEDDLEVVHDWLGVVDVWLTRYFAPSAYRLATFYAPYEWVGRIWRATGQLGWWRYPMEKYYGTQCIAMRPDVADALADTVVRPDVAGFPDIRLKAFFHPDEHFLASVPSLVQHIGDESGLDTPGHRADMFPGEGWTVPAHLRDPSPNPPWVGPRQRRGFS